MGSLDASLPSISNPDYPCLNPLLQVSAFAAAGRVLHTESRLPLQAFGIVLVLLLAGGVAARTRQWLAIAAVVACAGTLGTGAATSAYADTLMACTLLATVDALVRWRDEGDPAWWRIACIAASTMVASKSEGLMLVALVGFFGGATSWSWYRQRRPLRRREFAWLLLPIAVVLAGQAFNAAHDLRNAMMAANAAGSGPLDRLISQFAEQAPVVLGEFGRMLVDPAPHRLLPALCIVAGLVAALSGGRCFLQSPAAFVVGCVVGGLGGYMTVIVSSPLDVLWQVHTGGLRVVEHLVPLAAFGCCLTIAPVER